MAPARPRNSAPATRVPLSDAGSKANALAHAPRSSCKKVNPSLAPQTNNHHVGAGLGLSGDGLPPPPEYPGIKTTIGPWKLGKDIAYGGTCSVRLVKHAHTDELAVAKIIKKVVADKVRARSLANLASRMETGDFQFSAKLALPISLEREIVIMRLLNHPNIVRIYDVWENCNDIYLIMEHVEGGELFEYISEMGSLDEKRAVFLFKQLVEALLYCHRLQIYHRDLKPENILIHRETMTIKLIDFGMAAYQPTGDKLRTPCGSPHYAAPELLHGVPYDGSKADVWSLGVVFFVMLTNAPPFNWNQGDNEQAKLHNLYEQIKSCRVTIPKWLSRDAQDLFHRIFVADPDDRIDIMSLWDHPLIHKYDREFKYEGRRLEDWIGASPVIDHWTPLTPDTIDPQILRNLRTLWHETDETTLVRRLISPKINQEKYFYQALNQYREQQLDALDHSPGRPGPIISPSDHHHLVQPKDVVSRRSRSKSQFSVLQHEHVTSKHSFFDDEDPASSGSYDPYRASREPSIPTGAGIRIKVRPASDGDKVKRGTSSRNRASMRFDARRGETVLRQASHRGSSSVRLSMSVQETDTGDWVSVSSHVPRTHSRSSIGSSQWLQGRSPIHVRPSQKHKKSVNFHHRRRSTPLGGHNFNGFGHEGESALESSSLLGMQDEELPSSPPVRSDQVIRSLKEKFAINEPQTPRTRRYHDIEVAARKVSNELGNICHEAFFRSSLSDAGGSRSSTPVPAAHSTETPPSSVSNRSSQAPPKLSTAEEAWRDRPLPPPPREESYLTTGTAETPGTYTRRTLHETYEKLSSCYEKAGGDTKTHFGDILRQIDNLIPTASSRPYSNAPVYLPAEDLSYLQSIPEEGRLQDSDLVLENGEAENTIVANKQRWSGKSTRHDPNSPTIRMVDPSSPAEPALLAPLNIRKTSGSSTSNSSPAPELHHLTVHRGEMREKDPDCSATVIHRKSASKGPWWRRSSQSKDCDSKRDDRPKRDERERDFDDLDDRTSRRDQQAYGRSVPGTPKAGETDGVLPPIDENYGPSRHYSKDRAAFPQTPTKGSPREGLVQDGTELEADCTEVRGKKKGFFKGFFQKKSKPVYGVDRTMSTNILANAQDVRNGPGAMQAKKRAPPKEWNLLDRLLGLKPESRVVIMCHPRKIARQLLIRLLMAEARGGISDVFQDPANRNSMTGKLVEQNKWGLKPMSFALELFSILRDGKQCRLTAARFTQVRGSGPSLRRLVELLCNHLENGHMHRDMKEVKEIVKLIQTGRVNGD